MDLTHETLQTCPICHGETVAIQGEIKTYVRMSDSVVNSKFRLCQQCDFSFMENPFTQESMAKYYSSNDQLRREGATPEEAYHINDQVEFLSKYSHSKESIMEVGADNGMFLDLFCLKNRSKGYYIEYNLDAADRLTNKGYVNASDSKEKFDAVVIRHTLEHIVDPLSYLQYLKNRMKTGSVLFVEVPDYTLLSQGDSDTYQLEHVNYFTLTSMSRLAKAAGLSIVASEITRTLGYSTTPNYVLRIILKNDFHTNYSVSVANQLHDWNQLLESTTQIYTKIDSLIKDTPHKKVALYGAGTRTVEYLASSKIPPECIIYDGDEKKANTELFGNLIRHSSTLSNEDFDMLIVMVVGYEKEVLEYLETKHVAGNKIITLNAM